MSTFLHDLRFAVRLLLKQPTFTIVAVVTLALGIGLNTAVFSAVDTLLLRPLPGVRAADELVQYFRTYPGGFDYGANSIPHYRDIRARAKDVFSDVAVWRFSTINLSTAGKPQRVMGVVVSANYFSMLGVVPERGRIFVGAEDEGIGAHPVAVVSHAAWQERFGGDEQIVGKKVILNGSEYTVVGVAPQEFRGHVPLVVPDIWVPLTQLGQIDPERAQTFENRGNSFLNGVARLAPGVSARQANARLQAIVADLRREFPDHYAESGINLVRQQDAGIDPKMRGAMIGLSAVVGAVVVMLLLIACVNVANLFLARAQDRWREMAVRVSIGARRSVLIRQLLVESLVFAVVAGIAGLGVAWGTIQLVNGISLPVDVTFSPNLQLSAPVLLMSLLLTIGTGILFGLAPALQATRPSLVPALKGEAPAGGARSRLSRVLVVTQMALSLVLLVCAGLFLRSLGAATAVDKGFNSENLLLAQVDPSLQGYSRERTRQFYVQLTERLQAVPGVTAVGYAEEVPLSLGNQQRGVEIPGYVPRENENMSIDYNRVTPGYFEAMGIPLVRGRGFAESDDSASAGAAVVNEAFAERFWPGKEAVGQVLKQGSREFTVVGLVATGKYHSLGEQRLPFIYYPQAQLWTGAMIAHVRVNRDPTTLIPVLRSEVAALDADLPVSDVKTMENHLGLALLPSRLAGTVLAAFGLLGLVLAAVGMYGVMAYSISQRTREIGIRIAIGAGRGQVLALMMRQGLQLVAIGGVIGIAVALGASRLIRGVLYGASAVDPLTYFAVPFLLFVVAAAAIWIPARRAATIEPVSALRGD